MDYSPPGSSVPGISQASIPEWVAPNPSKRVALNIVQWLLGETLIFLSEFQSDLVKWAVIASSLSVRTSLGLDGASQRGGRWVKLQGPTQLQAHSLAVPTEHLQPPDSLVPHPHLGPFSHPFLRQDATISLMV